MFDTIDDTNFLLVAAKAYNNPGCVDIIEFYSDLEKFKHIKKILNRYKKKKKINVRLYLNHFILLYNVFDGQYLTQMLCFKFYKELECIAPVLKLLGFWKPVMGPFGMRKEYVYDHDIIDDAFIKSELEKI